MLRGVSRRARHSLAQLVKRRAADARDGVRSQDEALVRALEAAPWADLLLHDVWLGAMLSADVDVARELVEAHTMVLSLESFSLTGLVLVDCGCSHGLTSLLLWHMLDANRRPASLLWIDRDKHCRAATSAPTVLRPPTQFVCADFLSSDFSSWPLQPCAVLCVRVCGARLAVCALFAALPQARKLVLVPCCEDNAADAATILCDKDAAHTNDAISVCTPCF